MTKTIRELVSREDLNSLERGQDIMMSIERSGKQVRSGTMTVEGHSQDMFSFMFKSYGDWVVSIRTKENDIALNGDRAAHCNEDNLSCATYSEDNNPKAYHDAIKLINEGA